jgi:multidrug resistance efflux pump
MKEQSLNVFQELHSDEVQEIISSPPSWIVKWGVSLFVLILVFIGIVSYFIKYPDVVPARFVLSSRNAPRQALARANGKVEKILVNDGMVVDKLQPLAYIESSASTENVLKLDTLVKNMQRIVKAKQWNKLAKIGAPVQNLGDIQQEYQRFYVNLVDMRASLGNGYYQERRKLLLKDFEDLKNMERILNDQYQLQEKDYRLAKEEYSVQQELFKSKVISSMELKKESAKLIAREMPLSNLSMTMVQNKTMITSKQKEVNELDNLILERYEALIESLNSLHNAIQSWKYSHIITAPVRGAVSYSAPWLESQTLKQGEEFATISPSDDDYIGIVKIAQSNFGKIKVGQRVLIKLDGYPHREFGSIEGSLLKLSKSPGTDSTFWGFVKLPKDLITKYKKNIAYSNGLTGTAEIITTEKKLIERLLMAIRLEER